MNSTGLSIQEASAPVAGASIVRMKTLATISITCYENAVPSFVETELARLYGNVFSSLEHLRAYRGTENINTYVARSDGEIASVLLFCRERNKIQVLNEGMLLSTEEVQRFANYIFSVYSAVHIISFHAVRAPIQKFGFPCQRFTCLEDIVLELPASVDEYRDRLGKSTRSYLNRYLNKLKRNFPSFRHEIYEKQDIDEQHIREILRFNRQRMASKGRIPERSDEDAPPVMQLARECGLVSVITIDGRVRAGTINYHVGNNYFLDVISHDPAYDEYRLGTLCCFLTVCTCILMGGSEYHFLWGRSDYKYRLLGAPRNLDDLVVYRSPLYFLRNGGLALKNAYAGYRHQGKDRLREFLHSDRAPAKFALDLLKRWRG